MYSVLQTDSIMRATAPVPGDVDASLLQSASFLRDCAHDLRLKIRTFSEKKDAQVWEATVRKL